MTPGYAHRRWTSPDGLELHARDYAGADGAARPPVFCLHGLTRNARDFEDIAPAIAATGRRVLAFDMRGRGRSAYAEDAESYAVPVYVADVNGWAQALGVARADMVGTSMGGLMTMSLAAAAPALVGDVVLNDIGPEIAPAGLARILAYAGEAAELNSWADAVAYVAAQNAIAFPDYGQKDWETFAARLVRMGRTGAPSSTTTPGSPCPCARPLASRRQTFGPCSTGWRRADGSCWCAVSVPMC